jgi:hypothetical protein
MGEEDFASNHFNTLKTSFGPRLPVTGTVAQHLQYGVFLDSHTIPIQDRTTAD